MQDVSDPEIPFTRIILDMNAILTSQSHASSSSGPSSVATPMMVSPTDPLENHQVLELIVRLDANDTRRSDCLPPKTEWPMDFDGSMRDETPSDFAASRKPFTTPPNPKNQKHANERMQLTPILRGLRHYGLLSCRLLTHTARQKQVGVADAGRSQINMKLDPDIIAEGWYDLHASKLTKQERALGQWAEEALREAIYHDGVYAFEIISAIHHRDSDQKCIEVFAAGPIEDLLAYQGATVIRLIEEKARQDPSFAQVLGGVWQNSMTDEIWERVKRVRKTDSWADSRI